MLFRSVAALKVLGQIATLAQLKLNAPRPSPVVLALDYPDPRVQLAAASAILQADPKTPFRGAPRVVEVLRRSWPATAARTPSSEKSRPNAARRSAGS